MIQTRYKILSWLTMGFLLAVVCGFQTSFWFQLTGGAPAPQLWLLILLYLVLYRPYPHIMLGAYGFSFVLKSFSAIPFGIIWPLLFLLISPASYVKSRMFWPSTRYFIIASACFVSAFHILIFLLSHALDPNPTTLSFFSRLSEIILTTVFAAPLYWFLLWVDKWTRPEIGDARGVTE